MLRKEGNLQGAGSALDYSSFIDGGMILDRAEYAQQRRHWRRMAEELINQLEGQEIVKVDEEPPLSTTDFSCSKTKPLPELKLKAATAPPTSVNITRPYYYC